MAAVVHIDCSKHGKFKAWKKGSDQIPCPECYLESLLIKIDPKRKNCI